MKINYIYLAKSNPLFESDAFVVSNISHHAKVILDNGENEETYKISVLADNFGDVVSILDKFFKGKKIKYIHIKPVKSENKD